MSSRKAIANVIGLAGCAAAAWGFHGLMLIGSCGGDGGPQCPPESIPSFIAVAAGMTIAIVAAIAGGRLAFFGLFLAIAAGAIWAGLELPSGERTGPLIIGATFAAGALVQLALLPAVLRRRRRTARLMAEGKTAIGTVIGIRDTGVTVNNNPRVELVLRIEPQDGSLPFEAAKTITVSRLDLPYRGRRFPVWYDRDDPNTFALGTHVQPNAAPEVRRLFALAESGNPPPPTDGAAAPADPLDRLAKLNELRLAGALTDAEFEAQKAKILGS